MRKYRANCLALLRLSSAAAAQAAQAQKLAHDGEMMGKYVLIADPVKAKER